MQFTQSFISVAVALLLREIILEIFLYGYSIGTMNFKVATVLKCHLVHEHAVTASRAC